MTLEKAEEILREDYITYGVMMVKEKIADGLVAGACHATADTFSIFSNLQDFDCIFRIS